MKDLEKILNLKIEKVLAHQPIDYEKKAFYTSVLDTFYNENKCNFCNVDCLEAHCCVSKEKKFLNKLKKLTEST